MKFAAIADIHGNSAALEAVLADTAALGIADVVNLGDHVSGPLEAARTADMLMERGFPSVQGDQDRILVELDRNGGSKRGDLAELERRHLDWMASLPPTLVYRDDVFLCHGSPRDDAAFWLDRVTADGVVRPNTLQAIEAEAEGIGASLIICGHTHIPRVVRLRDGRMTLNPGSVGLPGYGMQKPFPHTIETGIPDACYAIVERARLGWSVTIRYVPYDSTAMAALAREKGMPLWANSIATGWCG
jgi:predicted phosphodiesterase